MRLAICFPSFKARITMTWQTRPGSVSSISKCSYWRNQAGRQNRPLRKPKGIAGTVSGDADLLSFMLGSAALSEDCACLGRHTPTGSVLSVFVGPAQQTNRLNLSLNVASPIRSGLLHVIHDH